MAGNPAFFNAVVGTSGTVPVSSLPLRNGYPCISIILPNPTRNDLIAVSIGQYTHKSAQDVVDVTDSYGQTYTEQIYDAGGLGQSASIWTAYCRGVNGTLTIYVRFQVNTSSAVVFVSQYSGVLSIGQTTGSNHGSASSQNAVIATQDASNIVLAAMFSVLATDPSTHTGSNGRAFGVTSQGNGDDLSGNLADRQSAGIVTTTRVQTDWSSSSKTVGVGIELRCQIIAQPQGNATSGSISQPFTTLLNSAIVGNAIPLGAFPMFYIALYSSADLMPVDGANQLMVTDDAGNSYPLLASTGGAALYSGRTNKASNGVISFALKSSKVVTAGVTADIIIIFAPTAIQRLENPVLDVFQPVMGIQVTQAFSQPKGGTNLSVTALSSGYDCWMVLFNTIYGAALVMSYTQGSSLLNSVGQSFAANNWATNPKTSMTVAGNYGGTAGGGDAIAVLLLAQPLSNQIVSPSIKNRDGTNTRSFNPPQGWVMPVRA